MKPTMKKLRLFVVMILDRRHDFVHRMHVHTFKRRGYEGVFHCKTIQFNHSKIANMSESSVDQTSFD